MIKAKQDGSKLIPKILVLATSWFPPEVSGEANILKKICEFYDPGRFVYIAKNLAGSKEFDSTFPCRVHRLKYYLRNGKLIWRIIRLLEIAMTIGKERPDVILVGNGRNAFEARNALRLFRRKVPYVTFIHGTELLGLKPKSKAVRPYIESTCLIANSEYTKSLAKGLEVPEERVKVLRPGCDPHFFRPGLDVSALRNKLRLNGKKVLLTVGGLVERKGQDMVIRALTKLRREGLDVHYLIAGTGIYLDQLKALVEEMSVAPYITFLGHVDDSDLPFLFNLCDLFIMPSREALGTVEGFGMVFAEAAACGKPCIAGRSGGMAEAVIDGKTGLIVDSSDIDSIAGAATNILTDEQKAGSFGMEGRRFVERELSWPVYFEGLMRILRSSSFLSSHYKSYPAA